VSGPHDAPRHTIGVVLRLLKDDFPDVTVSKLRFLESEGLVAPDRTPAGYRTYADADVERLRTVLTLQRDQFLPLKVIRARLDATSNEGGATWARSPGAAPGQARPSAEVPPDTRLSASELSRQSRVEATAVQQMVSFGLLRPDPDGRFDAADLEVARAASELVRHGVEVRHLRPFRSAADRELDLVRHVVAPVASANGEAGEEAEALTERLLHTCLDLHQALVSQARAAESRPRRGDR
jgi:DNA-binding transcriptional MerR regulator